MAQADRDEGRRQDGLSSIDRQEFVLEVTGDNRMLALKLHKTKRPNLGATTYWIPIIDWKTAKVHIRNWYATLQHPNRGGKGVNFITMVSIPRDHPVCLKVDWSVPVGVPITELPFVPFRDIEPQLIDTLRPLERKLDDRVYHIGQGLMILGDGTQVGAPLASHPELIVGAPLPKSCVKWTKDIRLLFRGDTRKKKPSA